MTADPGLFGPDSVTWQVHSDPTMVVAGIRALFLQALHPVAMAGVAANSRFSDDPWGRLQRTADYIGVTTFGTTADANKAGARIRGIHRRLTATDPDTGVEYPVDDPPLLLWIHCCEVDSFLSTARRGGARISAGDADRYVAEQIASARLVGLDPSAIAVPTTVDELAEYFVLIRPDLYASSEAQRAARFIVSPPMPRWVQLATPAVPGWLGVTGLGFALLPGWARKMYSHLPGVPTTDIGATLVLRALRTAVLAIPPLREGPHQKAARERLGLAS